MHRKPSLQNIAPQPGLHRRRPKLGTKTSHIAPRQSLIPSRKTPAANPPQQLFASKAGQGWPRLAALRANIVSAITKRVPLKSYK